MGSGEETSESDSKRSWIAFPVVLWMLGGSLNLVSDTQVMASVDGFAGIGSFMLEKLVGGREREVSCLAPNSSKTVTFKMLEL